MIIVFISPERSDVVGISDSNTQLINVKGFFDVLTNGSYCVFDSGYKYMYDRFNDGLSLCDPLNGDVDLVVQITNRTS